MFSISRESALYGGRKPIQLLGAALTAAMLGACAQSSVVTNKNASLVTSRQVSLGPNRAVSLAANNKHTAGSRDALYGLASFYTEGSETASGEKFDLHNLTCCAPYAAIRHPGARYQRR